jgi:hypothetical protein
MRSFSSNDGSSDDLASAVGSYGDRITLIRTVNGGAASARNLGLVDRYRRSRYQARRPEGADALALSSTKGVAE